MTARYREILVPLDERETYLLQVGIWITRRSRSVRARENEFSERIPLITRLNAEGKVEHLFEESCGCRYTISLGTPKVSVRCGKGRECKFFVK